MNEQLLKYQASVVQKLDSAIHRINHYPADKYQGNQLSYPVDRFLPGGWRYPTFEQPGPGADVLSSRRKLRNTLGGGGTHPYPLVRPRVNTIN